MLRIVIVDDEKMIRESMVKTFPWEKLGIEVVGTAENGKRGLEVVAVTRPHIILTDIRMPKMDGLEFIRSVREYMKDVRIIIISGYDEFAYAKKAMEYGVSDYILKPVSAEELFRVLQKLVQGMEAEFSADLFLVKVKKEISSELDCFLNAIRLGDPSKSLHFLKEMIQKLMMMKIAPDQFRQVCLEISNRALEVVKHDGIQLSGNWRIENDELYRDLGHLTTLMEIAGWFEEFTGSLVEDIGTQKIQGNSGVVQRAIQYINSHFQENLSVKNVADYVGLNPDYFSHVFKKVRGESFSDYLNQLRIHKATELLVDNLYKVYEVSDMVGYNDYKYFSSVFKKITGVSPTDYHGLLSGKN